MRDNSVTAIDGAEKAATSTINAQQAAITFARSTAEVKMSQATNAVEVLRVSAERLLDRMKDEAEVRRKATFDQLDRIVATIPDRVTKVDDSTVALD